MTSIVFKRLFFIFALSGSCFASLPPLSDDDLAATQGHSPYHSALVRSLFADMHQSGDSWPEYQLETVFLGGLYQHYVHQFSGYNPEYNYFMFTNRGLRPCLYDRKEFIDFLSFQKRSVSEERMTRDIIDEVLPELQWICFASDALKRNQVFRKLGADFQRQKVVVEKQNDKLDLLISSAQSEGAIDSAFKILMAEDRKAVDQQTAIFHWTKQVFEDSLRKIAYYREKREPLPSPEGDEFIRILPFYIPGFLQTGPYHRLIC